VFAERGYAAATMTQIAQQAGVSVESVHGVGTKSALLVLAFKQRSADECGRRSILDEIDQYAAFIAAAIAEPQGLRPPASVAWLSTAVKKLGVVGVDLARAGPRQASRRRGSGRSPRW